MNIVDKWEFWVVIYLISEVVFAQTFKKCNRKMKNASALTVLLEIFTAVFAIFFIPLFQMKFPSNYVIYLILFVVTIIYALTDRLNIEARYGLDPSAFSMMKQLSTVFIIVFGIILFNEDVVIKKIIGSIIILFSNFLLTYNKGKICINKYFIMSVLSNFLFAVAMLINVDIADNFNLGIYTIITVSIPSIIISIFSKIKIKDLKEEYNLCDKKLFIVSAFTWCLMLISSVRAYQIGNVVVVASLFALTSILNCIIEVVFNKDRSAFIKKIICAILIILGVLLIRL